MKHAKQAIGAALVSAGILCSSSSVSAGSAATTLAASASVANNCTISTAALAFGSYDPVVANASANLDGAGTVTIACTKGASTTIGLGLGSNASGSTRRLSDGSSNFLTYEIYQESTRTTIWSDSGAGLLTPPVAPSKASRNFTAYGRVASGQDVPAGSYSDSVTATVNF